MLKVGIGFGHLYERAHTPAALIRTAAAPSNPTPCPPHAADSLGKWKTCPSRIEAFPVLCLSVRAAAKRCHMFLRDSGFGAVISLASDEPSAAPTNSRDFRASRTSASTPRTRPRTAASQPPAPEGPQAQTVEDGGRAHTRTPRQNQLRPLRTPRWIVHGDKRRSCLAGALRAPVLIPRHCVGPHGRAALLRVSSPPCAGWITTCVVQDFHCNTTPLSTGTRWLLLIPSNSRTLIHLATHGNTERGQGAGGWLLSAVCLRAYLGSRWLVQRDRGEPPARSRRVLTSWRRGRVPLCPLVARTPSAVLDVQGGNTRAPAKPTPLTATPPPSSTHNGAPRAGMDDGMAGAARFRVHAARGLWVESGGVANRASAGWAAAQRPVPSPWRATTVLWGGEGLGGAGCLLPFYCTQIPKGLQNKCITVQ
jgi:hypothetical protein